MKDVLDPLTRIPGVRWVLLVSEDGVPIASARGDSAAGSSEDGAPAEDLDAFCGLTAGWYDEVHRAVDPLAWNRPHRISMRCARGTLVLQHCERAILAVLLNRGVVLEDLRLPMEAAIARLGRNRRRIRSGSTKGESESTTDGPPGLFPGVHRTQEGSGTDVSTEKEVPETSGER